MSTSSTTPIYFNGTSSYSSDLQQVISHAVSMASLPISQLSDTVSTLSAEQSALSNLSTPFTNLQNDIAALDNAVGAAGYAVSNTNTSVASATATSGAMLGTYTLQVIDPGSQASAASTGTVSDPTTENVSSSAAYTLTANGQTYTNIVPPVNSNTLDSLVSAINTATQGAVEATVVNIGTPSSPLYELSIQNTSYGSLPITLTDSDGNNLLNTPTPATSVQYTINGQPSADNPLTSDSRTLQLSQNLTATVAAAGTANITVSQSTTGIANALNSLVNDYNSAVQSLTAQRGTNGGALAGQSVIDTLSLALQSISTYLDPGSGSGSIQSMYDIGVKFNDNTGVLSFDPSKLSAAAAGNFAGLTSFLGGATTGGFLLAATNILNGVLDSTTGAIPTELNSVAGQIISTNNKISADQDRVNQLTTNLTQQMANADALIASLQSQNTYLLNLFTSMTANQNQIANG